MSTNLHQCGDASPNAMPAPCNENHVNAVQSLPVTFDQYGQVARIGDQVIAFKSHGYWYDIDGFGVIHQRDPQPFVYDEKYVSTYDTEAYRRGSETLQALRLGFVLAAHEGPVHSLLDYGYGNGAFMKFALQHVPSVFGLDVTGIPVEGCSIATSQHAAFYLGDQYDVITFWDALEHVPDLSFVEHLPCATVVISLPWCHYSNAGQEWFDNDYPHRKPNEHLHHFNLNSLNGFMRSMGWRCVAWSHHEDIVRKPRTPGTANILTMAFRR